MHKAFVVAGLLGGVAFASLPAVAQTGRIDPGVGAGALPLTPVQFRGGGHRFHAGGPRFRHGFGGRGIRGYGGYGHYRYGHRGGYGVGAGIAGLAAGALIGGAIASQAAPVYDAPVYADPPAGGDAVGYCMQRFKSYDPGSGTYLGYDGQRHPCP